MAMKEEVIDENVVFVKKIIKYVITGLIACILFFGSWFTIGPGTVGVVFNTINGQAKTVSQGTHFKIPWFENVTKFDVRTQRIDVTAESASKDLQQVQIHIALNIHLQYDKVNDLYTKIGADYSEKVIDPAVNESVKAATAQLPVEEIIVRREYLKETIETTLATRLAVYNITLESLNLVNIGFTKEFEKVVEDKQIEEQKIKTAEYQKRQAEQYKQKTILEAEAQAKQQELMRQSATPNIIALEYIKKWNGVLPQIVTGDKGSMMMITPDLK